MKKLRAGDPVIVISGKHQGKISTIEKFVDAERVIVAGVNEVQKAKKGEGFITVLKPLHVSSVQYYLEGEKSATKISIVEEKGKKLRVAKKTGAKIDK